MEVKNLLGQAKGVDCIGMYKFSDWLEVRFFFENIQGLGSFCGKLITVSVGYTFYWHMSS